MPIMTLSRVGLQASSTWNYFSFFSSVLLHMDCEIGWIASRRIGMIGYNSIESRTVTVEPQERNSATSSKQRDGIR